MSLEQLLFLLLLLGVPLLERLSRALRERMADSRDEPASDGAEASVSRPEVSRSPRPTQPETGGRTTADGRQADVALPGPPLAASRFPAQTLPASPFATPPLPEPPALVRPKAAREAPEPLHPTEREPRRTQEIRRRTPAASRVGRPERAVFPGRALRGLPASELRRAVVLMAILGPCRALEAKDTALPS